MPITFDTFDPKKLRIEACDKYANDAVYYGERKFWRDIGNCRHVYKLDKVVVKFDWYDSARCATYRQTSAECRLYKKIKKADRQYFPRTRAVRCNRRLVEVQELVKAEGSRRVDDARTLLASLEKKYGRTDYHFGNVIMVNGKPIIVDFGL